VKDPRLSTTDQAYQAQFKLHMQLIESLSKLKATVNRLRLMKKQINEAAARAGQRNIRGGAALRRQAATITQKLSAIEKVMVDPERKSARDVLRNPAGLNDTLFDMVQMTTTADAAPTVQTLAVSRETMAKVDREIEKFEALVKGDIARFDKALAKARIGYVTAA
jgi:hypothetical protein